MSAGEAMEGPIATTKSQLFNVLVDCNHIQNLAHKRLVERSVVESNPELKEAADKVMKAIAELHRLGSAMHFNMR